MPQSKSRQELLDTDGQVLCKHKYRMASLQATANVGDRNIQVMEIHLCDDCGANFKGERSVQDWCLTMWTVLCTSMYQQSTGYDS